MNTGDIGQLSQPGGSLFNIEHSNGGLITFPGGIPLRHGDNVIGAIGLSGSSVENDLQVAQAGAAAVSWPRCSRSARSLAKALQTRPAAALSLMTGPDSPSTRARSAHVDGESSLESKVTIQ